MISRFDQAFDEWTCGLDSLKSRISIFEHIRDMPYSIQISMSDPKTAPEQILSYGKGYCGPKHYLLAAMFRRLDLEVVYASFPFLWDDPAIRYPPELRRLAAGMPMAYHLACRARLNGRWVLVDATWDPPLARGGYPVNASWDGISDTTCAVTPLPSPVRTAYCRSLTNEPCHERPDIGFTPRDGEENHLDEDGHARYYHRKTGRGIPEEIEGIARFYSAFEAWLESLRK